VFDRAVVHLSWAENTGAPLAASACQRGDERWILLREIRAGT
jgi:hypothetical protein